MFLSPMKNKITLFVSLLVLSTSVFAQFNLNDYKYVIVEKQFHFQSEPNQYDLQRLVRFELEKLGFVVLLEGEGLPDELKKDICLALTTDITARGALRTKAIVRLMNCSGELVYQSGDGISKEKEFRRVYQLAIQKAFDTMAGINHNYVEKEKEEVVSTDSKEAQEKIIALEAEVARLKVEKAANEVGTEVKEVTEKLMKAVDSELDKTKKESVDNDSPANNEVVETEIVLAPEKPESDWREGLPSFKSKQYGNLYMKPGYKGTYLVNEENETVFKLQSTSKKDVYLTKVNGETGVAFYNTLLNNIQIEYYVDDELKTIWLD